MTNSFNSSEDATLALRKLKAFSDGGIDNVTVSASRGGYNFEVQYCTYIQYHTSMYRVKQMWFR